MKYEFGTAEWFAFVNGLFAQRAVLLHARSQGSRTSISETYYNVPPEIADGKNELSWSCVSEAGVADFRTEARDDAQYKVRGDFTTVRQIARYAMYGDPQRIAELLQIVTAAYEAGTLTNVSGDGFEEPGALASAHDLIAAVTL